MSRCGAHPAAFAAAPGSAPSWPSSPSRSTQFQCSTMRPSATRTMSITWISTSRPAGSIPWNGRMRAVEDLARGDLVAVGELVEDRRAEAGKRGAEALELLPHARGARRDPQRAAVVDDVRVHELGEGVVVGLGLVLVDEA